VVVRFDVECKRSLGFITGKGTNTQGVAPPFHSTRLVSRISRRVTSLVWARLPIDRESGETRYEIDIHRSPAPQE
jgi:hypothetical protein